jgi:hypothetical protein
VSTFPQQKELQDAINATAGDPAWKHRALVLPPGSHVDPQKEAELASQFDEIIMSQVTMAYDVMPTELGISPRVALVQSPSASRQEAQASERINERKAIKPLLKFLKDTIFDFVIQQVCGQADMEWTWEGMASGEEEESLLNVVKDKLSVGLMSIDEARLELGMAPWGLPLTSDPGILTQTGFIPLGSIDPATGKPAPAQPTDAITPTSSEGVGPGGEPPSGQTPGHSGADAGNAQNDREVGSAPDSAPAKPANEPSTKAALAELDSLRRRIKRGQSIDAWQCKAIPQGVLDAMVYELSLGKPVVEVLDKARNSVSNRRNQSISAIKESVASRLGE